MNKIKILLLGLLIIELTACTGWDRDALKIKTRARTDNFDGLIFFSGKQRVVGLDKETDAIRFSIDCNTYIQAGPALNSRELLIADLGRKIGVWGERLYRINTKGKCVQEIAVEPNPLKIVKDGEYLLVDSLVYNENGFSSYSLYDQRTGQLVFQDSQAVNWVTNAAGFSYGRYFYIGIAPFDAGGKKSYFVKVDKKSGQVEKTDLYTREHPLEIYSALIRQNLLFIVYRKSALVDIFDLDSDRRVGQIDLQFLTADVQEDERDLVWLFNPLLYQNKLHLLYASQIEKYAIRKLITIDIDSLTLSHLDDIPFFEGTGVYELKAIQNDKLYWQDITQIIVMDYNRQHILQKIRFEL